MDHKLDWLIDLVTINGNQIAPVKLDLLAEWVNLLTTSS